MQRALDELAEHARTGRPIEDGTNWTCGHCYRVQGVKQYVDDRGVRGQPDYRFRLVCPCCSFRGCPHREPTAAGR